MPIILNFTAPKAPFFHHRGADDEENRLIKSLCNNLRAMNEECDHLIASVALFEFCTANKEHTMREWMSIAARSGAMSLRNYLEALEAVRRLVGRCKSIVGDVDTKGLKAAKDDFKAKFRGVEKLRHAVAHPELYANPDVNMGSNIAFELPGVSAVAGTSISEALIGNTYAATINGILTQYEVNGETALAVMDTTERAFSAFIKLDPLYERRTSAPR